MTSEMYAVPSQQNCSTYNLLKFLNGLIHFPFLEISIVTFCDIITIIHWLPVKTANLAREVTVYGSNEALLIVIEKNIDVNPNPANTESD